MNMTATRIAEVGRVAELERVIARQRRKLEEQDEVIRQLREKLEPAPFLMPSWVPHLTTKMEALLVALSDGRLHSKSSLMDVLYDHEADAPDDKIIDVFVCKLRRALKGRITIKTEWGRGYRMLPESVSLLRGAELPRFSA